MYDNTEINNCDQFLKTFIMLKDIGKICYLYVKDMPPAGD